jgi:hypothetical protein
MSGEFLLPGEPDVSELLERAMRDDVMASSRGGMILSNYGGAEVVREPYFQPPPRPLPPPMPKQPMSEVIRGPAVLGTQGTEIIDAHAHTSGMLLAGAMNRKNYLEDRAQMYTAGWLLRQGEDKSAYPLLADIKNPELRRMMLGGVSALIAEEHTIFAGIGRITAETELGQAWLQSAYERAANVEGCQDMLLFARNIASNFGGLTQAEKYKIEGMLASGFGVDDPEVTDLMVEYLDFMEQKNATQTHSVQARQTVANVKGMLAQYWVRPDDISQTIRICNTMTTEEDARSLITHVFEPLLAGFGEIPTVKLLEIMASIEDVDVILQVAAETNWMIRGVDIHKLTKYIKDPTIVGHLSSKQQHLAAMAVRLRGLRRNGITPS